MVHNVLGATAWLSDGTEAVFGPVDRLSGRAAKIASFVHDLAVRNRDEIEANWPKVLRRVAGYNLDIFDNQNERPYTGDGSVNLAHLLVGSEGTLAFTRDLTLKLVPLPKTGCWVGQFLQLPCRDGCRPAYRQAGPSAVELVDRIMIELALSNAAFRPTMETALIGSPSHLLVEFSGEDKPSGEKAPDLVALMGDRAARQCGGNADDAPKNLWEVRKAGLNIMMSLKGDGKPVSFIEDCAVPLRISRNKRR
jgi:FAD/FMN-containing dehydrogenase